MSGLWLDLLGLMVSYVVVMTGEPSHISGGAPTGQVFRLASALEGFSSGNIDEVGCTRTARAGFHADATSCRRRVLSPASHPDPSRRLENASTSSASAVSVGV